MGGGGGIFSAIFCNKIDSMLNEWFIISINCGCVRVCVCVCDPWKIFLALLIRSKIGRREIDFAFFLTRVPFFALSKRLSPSLPPSGQPLTISQAPERFPKPEGLPGHLVSSVLECPQHPNVESGSESREDDLSRSSQIVEMFCWRHVPSLSAHSRSIRWEFQAFVPVDFLIKAFSKKNSTSVLDQTN